MECVFRSLNDHPHGLPLIGRGTVIDSGYIAAGVTTVGHGGVTGGHGGVVAHWQCPNTRSTDADARGDADATSTGAHACNRPTNTGGAHSAYLTDSCGSGDPGGRSAGRADSD